MIDTRINNTSPRREVETQRNRLNLSDLKTKRKIKFDKLVHSMKSRSRIDNQNGQQTNLTINELDPETIKEMSKAINMRDMLKCSAELYDLYIKDHF